MTEDMGFTVHDPLFGTAPMAIDPAALGDMLASAERKLDRLLTLPTVDSLAAYRAARAARTENAEVRGKVGILKIEGPLVKRSTWLSQTLGWTSYEVLLRDFTALMDNRTISAVALYVDSPGGEVNGCDELAAAIYAARGRKPITAYVSGMAASAGYWLASAAEKIVVSDMAVVGSIGVVLAVPDYSKRDEARGVVTREFVSSQSPGKRPDIGTDAGRAQVQKLVDDLGAVFVKAVAKHRGVSTDTVIKKYGAGGVHIGANAVKAGMANDVGLFDAVLSKLHTGSSGQRVTNQVSASTAAAAPQLAHAVPGPTPDEIARAAKLEAEQRQAKIDAAWKKAADQASTWLPGTAVKSTD